MEITEDIRKAYEYWRQATDANITWRWVDHMGILANALRDAVAENLRYEFNQDHDFHAADECAAKDKERHNWTDLDWQSLAHRMLMGEANEH
jgi:hypothetical protein